jgi:hypothetical protein
MNPRLANRILIGLSIVYGFLIGTLAILNVSRMGLVAIIGAMALACLWAVRGVVVRRNVERRGPAS